jgi:hypothetical protein
MAHTRSSSASAIFVAILITNIEQQDRLASIAISSNSKDNT